MPPPGDLPTGPLKDWLAAKIAATSPGQVAARIDVHERALRRVMAQEMVGTALVDRWLTAYGEETIDDLYPIVTDELRPEEFCFTCRAFVHPGADDRCPWCEQQMLRPDLSTLPPREREEREEAPALMAVKHRPRVKKPPKPFYLDVLMAERKTALEVFVATGSLQTAGAAIALHFSGSQESAASAIRQLMIREGWYKSPGRGTRRRQRASNAAVKRVRSALRNGSWNRTRDQTLTTHGRKVFDEATLHEALWLYHGEGLGIDTIARRLLHRCNTNRWGSVKQGLYDEFERRGWPKRTRRGGAVARRGKHFEPTGDRRCRENGCRRWATASGFCLGHDPERAAERRRIAQAGHQAALADMVDARPFILWLNARLKREGVALVAWAEDKPVSYDWLADVRRGDRAQIRRHTIDKLCAGLPDTTFEDIYYPITDDEELAA